MSLLRNALGQRWGNLWSPEGSYPISTIHTLTVSNRNQLPWAKYVIDSWLTELRNLPDFEVTEARIWPDEQDERELLVVNNYGSLREACEVTLLLTTTVTGSLRPTFATSDILALHDQVRDSLITKLHTAMPFPRYHSPMLPANHVDLLVVENLPNDMFKNQGWKSDVSAFLVTRSARVIKELKPDKSLLSATWSWHLEVAWNNAMSDSQRNSVAQEITFLLRTHALRTIGRQSDSIVARFTA